MKTFTLEDLKQMLDEDAPGESADFANVTFRLTDGLPVVAAYLHEEDGKKIITLSDVEPDKRDPPTVNAVLSAGDAAVYWITGLQTHITHNMDLPDIRVKNYNEDEEYTGLDLFTDDPTNLFDGTWEEPIMVTEEEVAA